MRASNPRVMHLPTSRLALPETPVRRVNAGLPAPLVTAVPLARRGSQGHKGRPEPPERRGNRDPSGQRDPKGLPVLKESRVPSVPLARRAPQAQHAHPATR